MAEKRFTIIGNNSEIGVKEHKSGDVIVLTHRDLNSEQFVAQIVTFLNEQNEAIEKLIAKEKYWEQKAIQRINYLEEENEKLKSDRVRFEEETRLEVTRVMDKIFELIDKKIEFYKHKPVSAPISNPANPKYDDDVDRLARLSELEDLKETLKELSG